jgi:hypothetical protein
MNAREQRVLQGKVEAEQAVMSQSLAQLDMLLAQVAEVRRTMQDTVERLKGLGGLSGADESE